MDETYSVTYGYGTDHMARRSIKKMLQWNYWSKCIKNHRTIFPIFSGNDFKVHMKLVQNFKDGVVYCE